MGLGWLTVSSAGDNLAQRLCWWQGEDALSPVVRWCIWRLLLEGMSLAAILIYPSDFVHHVQDDPATLTNPTANNTNTNDASSQLIDLPLIPMESGVIYPEMMHALRMNAVTNPAGVSAALAAGQLAGLFTLRDRGAPVTVDNLHATGTEVKVQALSPIDGGDGVLLHGQRRIRLVSITQHEPHLMCQAAVVEQDVTLTPQLQASMRAMVALFRRWVGMRSDVSAALLDRVAETQQPGALADLIASALALAPEERLQVLDTIDPAARLRVVTHLLGKSLTLLELEDEIEEQVHYELQRGQRETYLREQLRVIQSELGEADVFQREADELRERVRVTQLPAAVQARALKEIARLDVMPPMAPEIGQIHTYVDWLVSVPWQVASEDRLDLAHAEAVLDEDHYGLPRVKDRVLEYIAVRKLAVGEMQTPVLCFVGPPGTGKTSLGKSIARALGRTFVRVSLGGVRDEAEIRGHRRTYVGALPGRIIQTMRRAGTVNPVLMLDEIDKLGADFHGDPAAALLEVLDPEQNSEFFDHYLDMPYDLSQVLFITTANDLYPLPEALEDRLEIIEFPGYIEEEKLALAKQFLIPNQLGAHGLADAGVHFQTSTLQMMIREYTYEAGVRNLNRRIAEVLRKVARQAAQGKRHPKRITSGMLDKMLGAPEQTALRANDEDQVGVITGMAWTSGGGDIMTIEVSLLPGKGSLMLTGQLGEVMQESAQLALSYTRGRADDFDIPHDDFEEFDLHVHLPEGAVPKDGPSAGVTLAAAMVSVFTEAKLRSDYAMTGEITLRGTVLPVGGIREKVMAARRARIKNIILPADNERDLVELPKDALRDLNIIFVSDMQQVLDHVLHEPPAERTRDAGLDEDDESEVDERS